MSAEEVRETIQSYMEALLARRDYRRFFADDIRFEVVGTDQRMQGAESAEQAIRFPHEVAFDARPQLDTALRIYMAMDQLLGQISTAVDADAARPAI